MTRLMTMTTAITALTAGAALAATDLSAVDMDDNGFASIEEVRSVFPEMSAVDFEDIDQNDDNRISSEELLDTQAQTILARYEMAPTGARGPVIVLDNDSDGFITLDDMRRAYPTFTDLDFEEVDENDDNRVSYREFYATEAQDVVARYGASTVMDIAEIDMNGDSFADFDEMVAAYPGLTELNFEEIDENDDNRVSSQELYAPEAQEIVSRSGS